MVTTRQAGAETYFSGATLAAPIDQALRSWMSDDDVKAEIERLRRENEALKKGRSEGVRMKVSEKGAVSVYGMGRFPVTLYKEQWLKLLNHVRMKSARLLRRMKRD